ncbi:hypothetical protein [Acidovorax sp. Root219]|uniref:hypothetical protein n=1 Tax=Acidovorax sp. Root219 TaxID=1736493 RepID=UPI001F3E8CFF|nr:hypothetical protein [Acidovorax sp. Root219]
MESSQPSPRNCCGICRATSYRKVIARDASGAMRTTEWLRCTGCEREFLDVQSWRQGVPRVDAPPEVDK